MNIPSKLQAGQPFKQSIVRKINQVIDYLKTQKIIGDRNTITVNQGVNGVMLSARQSPVTKGGKPGAAFNHPWKMSIITDENDEQKLKIENARIQIDAGQPDRIYFQDLEIDLPEEADEYYVIAYCVYQPALQSQTSINYKSGVFYMSTEATTADISNTYGFHTIVIGTLIVDEDEENNLSYQIGEQYYTSTFNIYDDIARSPFGGHLSLATYPQNGAVLQQFLGDKITINSGQMFLDDTGIAISQYSGTYDDDLMYCIQLDIAQKTAQIVEVALGDWQFFDDATGIYNIPIATAVFSTYGVELTQWIYGAFYFNIGGKVFLNQDDGKQGYLQDKLHYDVQLYTSLTNDEKQIYDNTKQYIKGITCQASSSSSQLYDQIYWDYSAIDDWNKSKDYLLNADNGVLKWSDFKVKVSNTDQKDYLKEKFEDTEGTHWSFTNNKCKVQITGLGKVKVNSADTLDYLGAKVESSKNHLDIQEVTPSDSSSSAGEIMAQKLDINLNIQGSGIIVIDGNGLSVIEAPQENGVLGYVNGEYTWIALGNCDSPCGSSSSSSGA